MNPWLEGNYCPVKEELLEADLVVEGTLPAALDGAYVRNGPNPLHQPIGAHHWCASSQQRYYCTIYPSTQSHTCRPCMGRSQVRYGCRFDGDGMLHAVRIKDGKAAYSNAYVQTSRWKQQKKAGRPLFPTVMLHCPEILQPALMVVHRMQGIACTRGQVAHIQVPCWLPGCLHALHESIARLFRSLRASA